MFAREDKSYFHQRIAQNIVLSRLFNIKMKSFLSVLNRKKRDLDDLNIENYKQYEMYVDQHTNEMLLVDKNVDSFRKTTSDSKMDKQSIEHCLRQSNMK